MHHQFDFNAIRPCHATLFADQSAAAHPAGIPGGGPARQDERADRGLRWHGFSSRLGYFLRQIPPRAARVLFGRGCGAEWQADSGSLAQGMRGAVRAVHARAQRVGAAKAVHLRAGSDS